MRLLLRAVFGQCPASWPESDYPDWWTVGRIKGPNPTVGYDGRLRQPVDTDGSQHGVRG